ncbi:hypothetical protein [Pseudoalteromonas sp. OOF1S-7]|uniref:hypothetical protein n=1 Tax=Pseudoalteromonas sp. OOF1S-7 TaxID=2917757 RepID=UPI001EF6A1CD|nr:hypothetical protein [Pseudoalteromonas sp. OOF1S-7]MCG7534776.1 hypothetical protein [Pseudoalteromonas sp. OOF1S-7]
MNYLSRIEQCLGNWRSLPDYPFQSEVEYAVFPSLNDELIHEALYKAIFEMNERLGNCEIVFKAFVDVNDKIPDLLVQKEISWHDVDKFQASNLVYEGFYTTGDKFNWLGIYHPDDYFIVGVKKEMLEELCRKVYGHLDWKQEFIRRYESGQLEIYKEDFDELKDSLLKED